MKTGALSGDDVRVGAHTAEVHRTVRLARIPGWSVTGDDSVGSKSKSKRKGPEPE